MGSTSAFWPILGGLLKRFLANWMVRLLVPFLFALVLRVLLGSFLDGVL